MKDERLTTFENCHGVETCQEQGKLFSLVWHLVLFLLHIERNVCGHACFSVQWTNFTGRLCQFVGRDVDTRIQIVSPMLILHFPSCEQLSVKSRWLSWTLFVAWHLDSSGHNCSSTAPRSNCRVHQLWHWLHIIDPYDGTAWRRGCRFYKPEADDWKKGLPWLASAAVFLFLFMWILLLLSFCHNAPQKAESDCGEEPLNVVEDLYVLVVLCCLYRFADFNIFPTAECMGSEPM